MPTITRQKLTARNKLEPDDEVAVFRTVWRAIDGLLDDAREAGASVNECTIGTYKNGTTGMYTAHITEYIGYRARQPFSNDGNHESTLRSRPLATAVTALVDLTTSCTRMHGCTWIHNSTINRSLQLGPSHRTSNKPDRLEPKATGFNERLRGAQQNQRNLDAGLREHDQVPRRPDCTDGKRSAQ